jgi:hypothetical protein
MPERACGLVLFLGKDTQPPSAKRINFLDVRWCGRSHANTQIARKQ